VTIRLNAISRLGDPRLSDRHHSDGRSFEGHSQSAGGLQNGAMSAYFRRWAPAYLSCRMRALPLRQHRRAALSLSRLTRSRRTAPAARCLCCRMAKLKSAPVKLGAQSPQGQIVLSGIEPGQKLAIAVSGKLSDGAKVRIEEP